MKSSLKYLDEAKQALGMNSDYEMSKWLNAPRATISNWRHGRNVMDDYAAARIAEALGIDPLEVIAAANVEREEERGEKGKERGEYWRKVFARCAAACLLVAAGAFETKELKALESGANAHYAQLRRRLRRALGTLKMALRGLLKTTETRSHEHPPEKDPRQENAQADARRHPLQAAAA